jgi:hypothetical protein
MLAQIEAGKAPTAQATPAASIAGSQFFGDASLSPSVQQTSQSGTNEDDCENKDGPKSQPAAVMVAAVKATRPTPPKAPAPPKAITKAEPQAGLELMEEAMGEEEIYAVYDVEAQIPKPTFEYKLLSKKQLGKKLQSKLNKMGAEGWEYCGRVGKQMMFKRMSGLEMMEAPEE